MSAQRDLAAHANQARERAERAISDAENKSGEMIVEQYPLGLGIIAVARALVYVGAEIAALRQGAVRVEVLDHE